MDLQLSGKRVLVTGASRGIGFSVAEAFLREGARVALNSSSQRNLEAAAASLAGDCLTLPADLGVPEEIARMFSRLDEAWGGLDILINNAAVMVRAPLMDITLEQWDRVMNTNLRGAFLCTRHAAERMIRGGGGVIINTSSNAAKMPIYGAGVYAAAKGGMNTLTMALAGELAPYHIRVNGYMPGLIVTEQSMSSTDAADAGGRLRPVAMRRYGETGEMAGVVLFLASPLSSYMTGETFAANGGKLTIQNPWKSWEEMK